MTITKSTIVGNRSSDGPGGIYVARSTSSTTIENSIIAGNSSNAFFFSAGGIQVAVGNLLINNSTIVDNQGNGLEGGSGGGLYNDGGTVQLENTILARNKAFGFEGQANYEADCAGQVTSLGHNLVGDPSGCSITLLASDLTGDPGLSGSQAPLETSQVVDAGDSASCTLTDQLGHSRIDGDGDGIVICDIGAIEFSPAATVGMILSASLR